MKKSYLENKKEWGKWFWLGGWNVSSPKFFKSSSIWMLIHTLIIMAMPFGLILAFILIDIRFYNLDKTASIVLLMMIFTLPCLATSIYLYWYWIKRAKKFHLYITDNENHELLIKEEVELEHSYYEKFNEIIETNFLIRTATKRLERKISPMTKEEEIRLRILFYLRHMSWATYGFKNYQFSLNGSEVEINQSVVKELIAYHVQKLYKDKLLDCR